MPPHISFFTQRAYSACGVNHKTLQCEKDRFNF